MDDRCHNRERRKPNKDGETKLLRFEENSIILEYSYFIKKLQIYLFPTKHTGKIIGRNTWKTKKYIYQLIKE